MRLRTFILSLVLLTLLGLCTVRTVVRRTQVQYRLGALLVNEEQVKYDMARLKAEVAQLRDPQRLEELSREENTAYQPLQALPPVELAQTNR